MAVPVYSVRTMVHSMVHFPKSCCDDDVAQGMKCDLECVDQAEDQETDQETGILADVGLFWKFDVDPDTGAPIGCPGFSDPAWAQGQIRKVFPDCPREMYAPEGKALSDIVETFADDQDLWIATFFDALERMLMNGYKKTQLTKIPSSWFSNIY